MVYRDGQVTYVVLAQLIYVASTMNHNEVFSIRCHVRSGLAFSLRVTTPSNFFLSQNTPPHTLHNGGEQKQYTHKKVKLIVQTPLGRRH